MDSLNLKYVKLHPERRLNGEQTKVLRFIFWRLIQAILPFCCHHCDFLLGALSTRGPFDSEKAVLPEVKRALEAQYKLDLPLHEQYFAYLSDLSNGDLGPPSNTRSAA